MRQLQRTHGNAFVARAIRSKAAATHLKSNFARGSGTPEAKAEEAERNLLPTKSRGPEAGQVYVPINESAFTYAPRVHVQRQEAAVSVADGEDLVSYPEEFSPEEEFVSYPEELSPEDARRLHYARTTLSRVAPLEKGDQAILQKAVPGAPVIALIKQRDEKIRQLRRKDAEFRSLPIEKRWPVILQMDAIRAEIEPVAKMIKAVCTSLGVTERDLVKLIVVDFPRLFVARAKQIAITQLDQNRGIAEKEKERFGLSKLVANAKDFAGLRMAAKELDRTKRQLSIGRERLRELERSARVGDINIDDWERVTELLSDAQTEDQEKRAQYGLQYPILLHRDVDLKKIAAASDVEISLLAGGKIAEILENIEDTKENIKSGDVKIWNLPDIVAMTKQDLGIAEGSVLEEAVSEHIRRAVSKEGLLDMAISALGITAAIVAIFATGGLALVAGGVALGVGAYQLSESVKEYMAESAAENVALDSLVADISANDPEMIWIVMDIAGLGLDVFDVINAVNKLRRPAQALLDTGDVVEFSRVAREVLPAAAANRVIATASRMAAASGRVDNAVRAVGDEFRIPDLEKAQRNIRALAQEGFGDVIEELRILHNIHPLNEDTLVRVLGEERAEKVIVDHGLLRRKVGGFYDPQTKHMFIREGSEAAVESLLVHEATHYLQHFHKTNYADFIAEYQAFVMQRNYLNALSGQVGWEAIPNEWRWLANSTDEDIERHILDVYGHAKPSGFDAEDAVRHVMALLKQF